MSLKRDFFEISWGAVSVALLFWGISTGVARKKGPSTLNWPVTEKNVDEYAFAKADPETVPFSYVYLFAALSIILLVATEYLITSHAALRERIVMAINIGFGLIESTCYATAIVEISKGWIAEPRPDFLSRCLPGGGTPTYDSEGLIICTGDETTIKEGRVSFPSGHSATSMAVGIYTTLYLLWTFFYRPLPKPWWQSYGTQTNLFFKQLRGALTWVVFFPTFVALGIVGSRVVDHRHSPADVVGASLLGLIFALFVALRVFSNENHAIRPESNAPTASKNESSSEMLPIHH